MATDTPLSTTDILILSVLADGPIHGYGLVKAVEERSEGATVLDPANLYRILRRMREDNWISEVPTEGYSRRRTYQLTGAGRAVFGRERDRLQRLVTALNAAGSGP